MFDERRSDDIELTAELAAVEQQLLRLAPAPLQLDRDRLMFAAGRAAGVAGATPQLATHWGGATALPQAPRHWFWPAATATMTAATLLLSAMLVWRSERPAIVAQEESMPTMAAERTNNGDGTIAAAQPQPGVATVAEFEPWSWTPQSGGGYLSMRNRALARGVGAIEWNTVSVNGSGGPTESATPAQPATARELLYELLPQAMPALERRS